MKYELQKVIMKNCTVYNILHESKILGHIVYNDTSKIIVSATKLPIVPIVESFGFEGKFLLAKNDNYEVVELKATPEFTPIFEFKVINLEDNFLTEA